MLRAEDRGRAWAPTAKDATSRAVLDIAAGRRPIPLDLTDAELVDLCARHGLIGLMALADDPHLVDLARAPYARLLARQQMMEHHLRRILLALDAANVPVAILKGPDIARWYSEPRMRTFSDIDLFVEPSHLERCLDVLSDDLSIPAIPTKWTRGSKRSVAIIDSSGARLALDIHWDLFAYPQLRHAASDASRQMWNQAEHIEDDIGPRWQMRRETSIPFLCAHAALDHRFRMILFRDFAEVSRGPIDWSSVIDLAREWRLASITYVALWIARATVHADVPAEVLDELRTKGTALHAVEALIPRTDLVRFDGHRPHPLNLAIVLLHDELSGRAALAVRAPLKLLGWKRRVEQVRSWRHRGPTARSRPRLTILVTGTQRRGAEVFGEQLAERLPRHGWDVDFVALSHGSPGAPTVSATPLSDLRSDVLPRLDLGLVKSLRRRLRTSRTEVLIANGSSTLHYGVAAARTMLRRPAVAYVSIGDPSYWAKSQIKRFLYRWFLGRTDRVFSVAGSTANTLTEVFGLDAKNLRILHTGILEEILEELTTGRGEALRVLFLGSLSPEKDPMSALETLALLSEELPVCLRFVGGGPLRDQLRARADELGLSGRVELIGPIAAVQPHLRWADVLLLTSRTEGLPAAALEAAGAGIPVVAFDVGGVSETVKDGTTGRLVPAEDVDAAAKALEAYATDEALRVAHGAAGRTMVRGEFTLTAAVKRYDRALKELLA